MSETTFGNAIPKQDLCDHDIELHKSYPQLKLKETKTYLYEQTDKCSKCGLEVHYRKYKWMPVSVSVNMPLDIIRNCDCNQKDCPWKEQ